MKSALSQPTPRQTQLEVMDGAVVMEFDPVAYLARLDPEMRYDIVRLTGGFINFTFRATRTSDSSQTGRFPDHGSLIIKHATPYMAGIGEAAPAPQKRQSIEALALSLFYSTEPGPLAHLNGTSGVRVPRCLHHDPDAHVLVMSDLGPLPDLSQIFADLGGRIEYPESEAGTVGDISKVAFPTMDKVMHFEQLGTKLGKFFAGLHSKETKMVVMARHSRRDFESPQMRAIVLDHAIKPVLGYLKLFPGLITDEEAEHLISLLVDDFERDEPEEELSFVLGDCWTSAVLSNIYDEAGIIDWEFAGFARGPHGDLAQLLAHLELLRISAEQDDGKHFPIHLQGMGLLLNGLIGAYTSTTSNFSSMEYNSEMGATILRSARLSYGAEIINGAFRKRWRCMSLSCQDQTDHSSDLQKCVLIRRMVEYGLWFLQHAGESMQAVLGPHFEKDTTAQSLQKDDMDIHWLMNALSPCSMSGHNIVSNVSVFGHLVGAPI